MAKKLKQNRYKNAYETRDKGGSGGNSYLNWKKQDGDIKFFKPKEGKNKINIIPFEVKSKNHPRVHQGILEVGDLDFSLDIFIHRNVGPNKASIVCPKKNYGKACPICDLVSEYYDSGKADEAQALKATQRSVMNIQNTVVTSRCFISLSI